MDIRFFDLNLQIVYEIRNMDHSSKEYKQAIKNLLINLREPKFLFNRYLKDNNGEEAIQKKYIKNLVVVGILMVLSFAWIFITVALTSGKEIYQFNHTEIIIFFCFILIEIITATLMFFFAFKSHNILAEKVSLLVDCYEPNCNYNLSSNSNHI